MDRRLLSEEERRAGLETLHGWRDTPRGLRREFRFASFREAFGFMERVAMEAESMNHHPDWRNSYTVVDIHLTTHDAGGVTALDLELARRINALAGETTFHQE